MDSPLGILVPEPGVEEGIQACLDKDEQELVIQSYKDRRMTVLIYKYNYIHQAHHLSK